MPNTGSSFRNERGCVIRSARQSEGADNAQTRVVRSRRDLTSGGAVAATLFALSTASDQVDSQIGRITDELARQRHTASVACTVFAVRDLAFVRQVPACSALA